MFGFYIPNNTIRTKTIKNISIKENPFFYEK